MNRAAISLLIIFWSGAVYALTPNQWRFRQTIEVPASGLVQVNLPAETVNIARPDLSDLRIFDANEKEVPFLIDQPVPRAESTVRPKDFHAEIISTETRLLIATGTDLTIAGITLETPAGASFIKSVRVEGSSDQKNWRTLTSGDPVFSMSNGAAKPRVQFPEGKWQFLRVVLDDSRTLPVAWTGARLIIAGSPAPTEPVSATIKSRDENPGMTRLGLDLGAANLRIASIRIGASEPVFTRAVTVAAPELSEEKLHEQTLSSGVLYRVDLNGKIEARLDVPIEKQIYGRELVLLIDNGDSPPLLISEVRADRRMTRLLFFAPAAGSYSLLSGNSQCDPPRYDLSQLGDQLRRAVATEGRVSRPVLNPGYDAAANLPQGFITGAKIEIAPWKFRKPVQVAKAGAQQLELDPDVLARAMPDLGDLRVVSENVQLPYLIERTSISRTVNLTATHANDRERPTISRWQLKLPQAGIPITRITCISDSSLFERTFRIWEELTDERGNKYPGDLAQPTWRRVPNQPARQLAASFERPPRSDTILIETENGDNPPIELHEFRGYYPATRVIFASPGSQPIALYYGNDEAATPRYDAKLIAAPLLRSDRMAAGLGPQEILKSEQVTETLRGSARYIFWGVLGIVVAALLVLISRLLPKVG
ncbi:MAG: hypothetical protein DME43_11385 [Verrucomicrobia bacterium]|nr:MAG: hypothetical protein DME43_11385 [Verrucomicrobiota bacterium]